MTTDGRSLGLPSKKQKVKLNRIRLATIKIVLHIFLGSDLFCLLTVGVEGYCCVWSHSVTYTPHTVGFLWTRDRFIAETSTWQHTTRAWDRQPHFRRDSNPQSQQARDGLRPRGQRDRHHYDLVIIRSWFSPDCRWYWAVAWVYCAPLSLYLLNNSRSSG